jgi:ribonucleoside-diphosphate reductase alpha chain
MQHGVPLEKYVDSFTFTRFEPNGMTNHPNIKTCTSVVDFIFRLLGMDYLQRTDFVHVIPKALDEVPVNGTVQEASTEIKSKAPLSEGSLLSKHLSEMMGDAPACNTCGHVTVRNGACYKCLNCGNSMGCS